VKKLIALLALACSPAFAALEFKSDTAHVVLADVACPEKVLQFLLPQWAGKFKGGYAVLSGRALRLCWVEEPAGTILIVDEEGDGAAIPKSRFKEGGV
jgi:hypothetical protein